MSGHVNVDIICWPRGWSHLPDLLCSCEAGLCEWIIERSLVPCKSNVIVAEVFRQHYQTNTCPRNTQVFPFSHRVCILSILLSGRCSNAEGIWMETRASWPVRTFLHTTNQTASALGTSLWVWIHVPLIHESIQCVFNWTKSETQMSTYILTCRFPL